MHDSDHDPVKPALPSERQFGLVFAVAFVALAGFRTWRSHDDGVLWLGLATPFAVLACFYPAPLRSLNVLWARLGALLHRLVTPVLMGLVFFAVLAPIGRVMRLLGQDPLGLRRDPMATSYWRACTDGTARPGAMKDQF